MIALHDDARAYIGQVSLMPADAVDGMDPEVVQMAREVESPLVPAGTAEGRPGLRCGPILSRPRSTSSGQALRDWVVLSIQPRTSVP